MFLPVGGITKGFSWVRLPRFRLTALRGICAGAGAGARGITGGPDAEDGGRGRG